MDVRERQEGIGHYALRYNEQRVLRALTAADTAVVVRLDKAAHAVYSRRSVRERFSREAERAAGLLLAVYVPFHAVCLDVRQPDREPRRSVAAALEHIALCVRLTDDTSLELLALRVYIDLCRLRLLTRERERSLAVSVIPQVGVCSVLVVAQGRAYVLPHKVAADRARIRRAERIARADKIAASRPKRGEPRSSARHHSLPVVAPYSAAALAVRDGEHILSAVLVLHSDDIVLVVIEAADLEPLLPVGGYSADIRALHLRDCEVHIRGCGGSERQLHDCQGGGCKCSCYDRYSHISVPQ